MCKQISNADSFEKETAYKLVTYKSYFYIHLHMRNKWLIFKLLLRLFN